MESLAVFRFCVLVVIGLTCLVGCTPPEEAPSSKTSSLRPAGETPEQTLESFIKAQREGDFATAKAIIYPDDSKYKLERAVVIRTYQILEKKVLTAAQAVESAASPPRMEGDVVLEVYEEYDRGRTSNVTYFMREISGEWRIYSLSFTI